jgi:hypothetical protein
MGTILPLASAFGSLGLPGLRFFGPAFITYHYCITKMASFFVKPQESYLKGLKQFGHAGGRLARFKTFLAPQVGLLLGTKNRILAVSAQSPDLLP